MCVQFFKQHKVQVLQEVILDRFSVNIIIFEVIIILKLNPHS